MQTVVRENSYWALGLFVGGCTWGLTPLVAAMLRRGGVVSRPGGRSSHEGVIPRGGGIAVLLASLVGLLFIDVNQSGHFALLVSVALGAVGLIDDVRSLSPSLRLTAQVLIPPVLGLSVVSSLNVGAALGILVVVTIVLWVAGFVNVFNFMDGINGISCMQAAVSGAAFIVVGASVDSRTVIALGTAVLAGAIGFLPHNMLKGTVFLGDVGSYFLGSLIACTTVIAINESGSVFVFVGLFSYYLIDAGSTLVRRWSTGERLFEAHRDHAYQHLVRRGHSHVAVSTICGATIAVSTCLGVVGSDATPILRALLVSCAVLPPALLVAYVRRSGRRLELGLGGPFA